MCSLIGMMSANPLSTATRPAPFDDGRGLFPDRVTAATPLGMRDRIRRAARGAGMTSAAFIRDAIEVRLRQAAAGPAQEI